MVLFHVAVLVLFWANFTVAALMTLVCGGTIWATSVFVVRSSLFRKTLCRLPTADHVLLTFDDGPHPIHTPQILEILSESGIKAVFFLIGNHALAHPDLVRRIKAEGHVIGNHSMTHPVASFWMAGPWRVSREVTRCNETLRNLTGIDTSLFRAPVGHHSFFLEPILIHSRMISVGWSRRGFDGIEALASQAPARLLNHLSGGEILVLHDSNPHIAVMLKAVIDGLKQRGLASFTSLKHDEEIVKWRAFVQRSDRE